MLVSSVSFLLPAHSYPARCGLLLTTLLVLVNIFNSALSNTPSEPSGLTVLAFWILSCIVLVCSALLFYVIILVEMKKPSNEKVSQVFSLDEEFEEKKNRNLDPIFLVIHTTSFIVFVVVYVIFINTV